MNINLMTWYADRQVNHLPKHFIKTTTPVTDKNLYWILENLTGRFYISNEQLDSIWEDSYAYFEDSKEAVLFELTWS